VNRAGKFVSVTTATNQVDLSDVQPIGFCAIRNISTNESETIYLSTDGTTAAFVVKGNEPFLGRLASTNLFTWGTTDQTLRIDALPN
jgi:hypothetical protein